jgi:hypothetical protein
MLPRRRALAVLQAGEAPADVRRRSAEANPQPASGKAMAGATSIAS